MLNARKHHSTDTSLRPKILRDVSLSDEARFIKSWFENPRIAGAITPSGRALARTMVQCVDSSAKGPIVELGPGTGPVTQALIERGIAQERLILVEFEPSFCRLLARRFPRATIVRGDAYQLRDTLASLFDEAPCAIVSSLPLLTRPEAARTELLQQAFAIMGKEGRFIQFTYGVKSPVCLNGRHAAGVRAQSLAPVWLNLPPARVWVYRSNDRVAPIEFPPDFLDRLLHRSRRVGREIRDEFEVARARLAGSHGREGSRHKSDDLATTETFTSDESRRP